MNVFDLKIQKWYDIEKIEYGLGNCVTWKKKKLQTFFGINLALN